VQEVPARRIITRNSSPDIGFDRSINPYRGCEHGCIYCFARPTHAFLGLSPGLDFETKLFAKTNAGTALERELADPAYRPRTIAIGTNTDPYQPIERRYRIMRRILEVLSAANHPVGIVTKSALVLRDLDILCSMAERGLVKVALVGHHARPQACPRHGAAREHAGQAPRDRRQAGRGRRADLRDDGAGHSRPH
jgi:DNA repair photolyase